MSRVLPGSSGNYLDWGASGNHNITGTQITIALWVYPTSFAATAQLLSKWNAADTAKQLQFRQATSGAISVYVGNGASHSLVGAIPALTINTWTHIGLSQIGSGANQAFLFKNGAKVVTGTGISLASTAQKLTMSGFSDNSASSPWAGRGAELGMWDIGLSDAEMLALASGLPPSMFRRDHLKLYAPLFGAGGSTEADLAAGSSNCTVQGTVAQGNHAPVGHFARMSR